MKSIEQRVKELPELRMRASAGGELAAGLSSLTDKQVAELDDLLKKPNPTVLQFEKIQALTQKRDNPELSEGCKTFVEKWLWEKMRQKKMELNNKYLAKGIIVEDDSIDLAERAYCFSFAMKNEKQFEDEFFTGTPDLFVNAGKQEIITDIKSSWDEQTFKLFDPAYNTAYRYQLQIYMHLTGIRDASLIYVLTNTPIHLIKKEAINYCYTFGYDIPSDIEDSEIYLQFLDKMTYDDLPDSMRVKRHDFTYDGNVIDKFVETIKACRTYKNSLVRTYFGIAA